MNKVPAESPAGRSMRELFAWMVGFNLDQVIRFHNAVRGLLQDQMVDPTNVQDRVINDAIELYDTMNSGNTLLMALSFLEEMLIIFSRRHLPEVRLSARRFSKRYRPLFDALGIDLGTLSYWPQLVDAMRIRNCLLHANGRVAYMERPDEIRRCVEQYPGLEIRVDRLRVAPGFLKPCVDAIRLLRDELVARDGLLGAKEPHGRG